VPLFQNTAAEISVGEHFCCSWTRASGRANWVVYRTARRGSMWTGWCVSTRTPRRCRERRRTCTLVLLHLLHKMFFQVMFSQINIPVLDISPINVQATIHFYLPLSS